MTHRRLSNAIACLMMGSWLLIVLAVPAHAQDAIIPTRFADHADAMRAALIAEGAPVDAALSLSAPDAEINVAANGDLIIETVSYNRASGRFLIRARGAPGEPLVAISGAAAAPVTLPVPARDIPRGGAVSEDDIDFIEIIDGGAGRYIEDADLIIGKEARRPLRKGAPLKTADLRSPILIKRGAAATVILESPGLRLTQVANALESGAEGDLIAFRNAASGAEFKAVVLSADLARAAPGAAAARHAALSPE
jgi:flagella basal body P-ring formation protein FlgA